MTEPETASTAHSGQTPTREQLLAEHAEWRRRRDAAPLGSEEFRRAVEELARIEIEVARVERSMSPPRV